MAQIDKPSLHFNTKLYTGNGSTNAITGVGFQPDWVWLKRRDGTGNHNLYDAVRGVTKYLESSASSPEQTQQYGLTAFGTDGFTLGSNANMNGNSNTYASWNWKAGTGQGSSNTDGSINTTYTSVNTTAGFSISQYTGTGSAGATVGHGLGAAPGLIFIKNISANNTNWGVYHKSLGGTKALFLDLSNQADTNIKYFNNTDPTSSVFTLGNYNDENSNGENHIAYCFAEKKGFSNFGSYTGNGSSTDGPFVYTGFKPAWIMIKESNGSDVWVIYDNKRIGYNTANYTLEADSNSAEGTSTGRFNILSNGFKITYNWTPINTSGQNYIYMAFAENPIVGSNNIPAVAR